MKQILEFVKKNIIKAAESCYKAPANFWQTAAITTISVYHLAQIAIVGMNKNTPKKEKAFLIPQEIIDGIINLITFVVFAASFKKIGRNLVKKGIIIPKERNKEIFTEEFATTTNLIGSLLAVNVVSPIIRNKLGADVQKIFIKKQNDYKTTFTACSNKLKI